MNDAYVLRYLELFQQNLIEVTSYIKKELKNPTAARKLANDVEHAILRRLPNPTAFEPYYSMKKRKHQYYRIYVGNYTIYYVVIGNIMEVRRLIYMGRDQESIL